MAIPTSITNRIRNVLDERLPRWLRDARWFMAPLFFVWCKGKHVREWMDFKELAPRMTVTELRDLYGSVDSFASGRLTDTNPEVTPVPIPNTAVKLCIADDTARATAWESRTPPG